MCLRRYHLSSPPAHPPAPHSHSTRTSPAPHLHPTRTPPAPHPQVLRRYFSFPKKVTVEVVPTPVPFPSISICNMRNLDVHVLNKLNGLFLRDDQPMAHINTTGHPFIDAYMTSVAKYAPLFWAYQEDHQEVGAPCDVTHSDVTHCMTSRIAACDVTHTVTSRTVACDVTRTDGTYRRV